MWSWHHALPSGFEVSGGLLTCRSPLTGAPSCGIRLPARPDKSTPPQLGEGGGRVEVVITHCVPQGLHARLGIVVGAVAVEGFAVTARADHLDQTAITRRGGIRGGPSWTLRRRAVLAGPQHRHAGGGHRGVLRCPGPVYRFNDHRYLRPAFEPAKLPPSPLMSWWLLLYSFSMLARYEPLKWTDALDIDKSPDAAALEYAMDAALEVLPHLVLEGLRQTPIPLSKPLAF
ncbi:YaaC family protein [Streptomyces mirabilis]|uniref:YaaC family protein n=1 Tax=Streptomyces mirabilis TaxID=68239 RepID=UPI0036B86255